MGDTAGALIGDTTTTEESMAPSRGASIGAHNLETSVQSYCPSCTVEEILGAHSMNDNDFQGGTNPSDVSIDTTNSEETMMGSHITESHTHDYKELVLPELLSKVPNVSQLCESTQKCQVDPLDKSKDSSMLSKTNNTTHAKGINHLSQENQDHYNQHDQQFIACKHDDG